MDNYTKFFKSQIVETLKTTMKESKEKLSANVLLKMVESIMMNDEVKSTLLPAFETPKPVAAAVVTSSSKSGDKTKSQNNWQSIWTSKDRGGRARFPADYDKIKRDIGEKTSHFVIMSKLRDLKEKDGGWKIWWQELKAKGGDVPKDPPTDRKKDKPASTSTAATTGTTTNADSGTGTSEVQSKEDEKVDDGAENTKVDEGEGEEEDDDDDGK